MKTYERELRLTADHDEAGVLLVIGLAHVRIGELLCEWNDVEGATRHLLGGIERVLEWVCLGEATSRLLEVTGTHDRLGRLEEVDADAAHGVVPGYIALARVRQAKGNTEGALEALRKVEQVSQSSRLSPLWNDRAERWGEAWLARLLITQGRHEEAEHHLGRLVEAAEAGGRGRTVTELLVLQALILRARNDKPEALTTLRRAVTLAEPEGYIRTFADEGEPMADLLQQPYGAWRTVR